MRNILSVLRWSLLLVASAFVTGCATPMPLNKTVKGITDPNARIGLLVIETRSDLRGPVAGHLRPRAYPSWFTPSGAKFGSGVDDYNLLVENSNLIHLVSVNLPEAAVTLDRISGRGFRFERLQSSNISGNKYLGNFYWKLGYSAQVLPERGAVYLGHLTVDHRLRANDSEQRAGGFTPIIDQRLANFWDGTFDVEISDQFDRDMAFFTGKYPDLAPDKVQKALLRPDTKP